MGIGVGRPQLPLMKHPRTILFAILFVLAMVHVLAFFGIILDDAFISFRYARHLAEGEGLVYNRGFAPVEGYTNFLLVVTCAALWKVGLRPELIVPLLGAASAGALVWLTARTGRALARGEADDHALAGLPAAAIVAVSAGFAFYAASGLETVPYALLLCTGGIAVAFGRPVAFGVLTALAFLMRPEAALLGGVGVGVLVVRRHWRRAATACAIMAAIVGPYLIFKLLYFGSLIPNTAYAKQPWLVFGARYALELLWPPTELGYPGGELLIGVIAAALIGGLGGAGGPRRVLLLLWVAFVVGTIVEGGDWMPAHRFFVPSLPWLALAADRALITAFVRRRARDVALIVGALAYAGAQLVNSHGLRSFYDDQPQIADRLVEAAHEISRRGARSVAFLDIGIFGYAGEDLEILDLAGLTDAVIAHSPGYHTTKQPSEQYLAERNPDLVIITSGFAAAQDADGLKVLPFFAVERYLLRTRWFLSNYRFAAWFRLRAGYYLNVFARRDLPGWGPEAQP